MLARIVQDAAVILLGLFAGAMLLIGAAVVGYWRSLEPEAFLAWFSTYAHRIGSVMIPLGVSATAAAIASAVVTWRSRAPGRASARASAALAVLVLVVYLAVHDPMNTAFTTRTVAAQDVPRQLDAWATWHWVRVVLGVGALYAQLLSIRSRETTP